MMSYLTLYKALQNTDGIDLNESMAKKLSRMTTVMCLNGILDARRNGDYTDRIRLIKPEAPQTAQNSVIEHVNVSFWQSGTRKGLFSQQAYKVVKRTDKFVTYELTNGKCHTMPVERTRVAA